MEQRENFNTYKVIDPENNFEIKKYEIKAKIIKINNDWIYKDFGKDYFGDFILELETKVEQIVIELGMCVTVYHHFASWQNKIVPMLDLKKKEYLIYALWIAYDNGKLGIEIKEMGHKEFDSRVAGLKMHTWYYLRIIKKGKRFSLEIFKDKERTELIKELWIPLQKNWKKRFFVSTQCHVSTSKYCWIIARNRNYVFKEIK